MSADMSFLLRPTLYVASAGTGKTHRLTEDFHAALRHYGYENAHRFIAITFTENASAEMRGRIQQKMLEKEGLQALPSAQSLTISTIHGFCRRELKRHALRLGLDPGFAVMEETEAANIARHALLEVLCARYNSEDKREKGAIPRYVAFASYFRSGSFGASLESEILADYNRLRAQGLRSFAPFTIPFPQPQWAERMLELQSAVAGITEANPRDIQAEKSREKLLAVQAYLRKYSTEIPNLKIGEQAARLLDRLCRPIKLNVAKDVKRLFENLLEAVQDCFHEMIRLDTFSVLVEMLQIFDELHTRLEAEKRARGALSFSDLELHMLRLLEDFPAVREEYRGRYHKVFVDEFQDTNPLQVRIIELLAEKRALYYVGDPKQSIFGWRYADPTVMDEKQAEFSDGTHTLTENWRSHPDILTFVNRLFGVHGAERELGFAYEQMTAARKFTGETPSNAPKRVALYVFPKGGDGKKLLAGERRQLNALSVAAYIRDLVANKRLAHTRTDSPKFNEPLTYGDFAILVRKNGTVPLFEQALSDANIPFVSETSVGFLSTPEISALTDFLQFLLTPENDLLCAQVLRSDLVGVSSAGFAELAKARGYSGAKPALVEMSTRAKLTHPDDAAAVAEFTQFVTDLRPRIPQLSVSAIISEAVAQMRMREKLAACGRPFRASLNIAKLIDFADGISGIGYAALESAASSFREMAYQGANIGEMFVEGGEFVKIMTIHRAKGMGFPAVIIGETDYSLSPTRQLFFDEREKGEDGSFRFAVKHRYERFPAAKKANLQYLALKEKAEAKVQEEELRLLYVALTRPIEHLAVFGLQDEPGKLWQSVLPRALSCEYGDIAEQHPIELDEDAGQEQAVRQPLAELAGKAKPRKADGKAAAALIADARIRPHFTLYKYAFGMSEFLRWMRGEGTPAPLQISDNDGELERELAEWRASHETVDGGEEARELGTAIHALLDFAVQHIREVQPHQIPTGLLDDALLIPYFREYHETLERSRERARKLLEGFMQSGIPQFALSAEHLRTEHAFMLRAAADGSVFLRGRCDLMLASKGELSILDYKTDRIAGAQQRDSLIAHYAPQLALYALATQALYPGYKLRAGLAFLDKGEISWIDGLPVLMEQVLAKLREFTDFACGQAS
jgi:ATP-dependent helicase/nuclease subunit A